MITTKTEQNLITHTLDAKEYTQDVYHKLDVELFVKQSWQLVAHESQLANVGDQIVEEICRIPIVIVRSAEDQVKAFYNVCRHRAGPVAKESSNCSVLRCQYHGWTYDLNGQLKVAPEMQSTAGFDIKDYQLEEIAVEIWNGFVFIAFEKTTDSASAQLSGIAELIEPICLNDMSFSHRQEYVIDCNWKVYMDNYLEGYHLPMVHPELNKILDYRSYTTELFENYSYQHSPLNESASSQSSYGSGRAHYFCVFPNLMLNILPNRIQTNQVYPMAADKCRVIFDTFYTNQHLPEVQKMIAEDKSFSDEVQIEDIDICQAVQKGLESGSYQQGIFCSARESGVQHFQQKVLQRYAQDSQNIPILDSTN